MSTISKHARVFLIAFGFAVAMPVALTIVSNVASASGYILASGIVGPTFCFPGGGEDCPDGGIIVVGEL